MFGEHTRPAVRPQGSHRSAIQSSLIYGTSSFRTSLWLSLWPICAPYVRQTRPNFRDQLTCLTMKSQSVSKHSKTTWLELKQSEMATFRLQRNHYPCSTNITAHYSFDYAQQVHIPSNPMQPGPIYFKTPRKCGIFGVFCEAVPRQVNFLIDEALHVGKGANPTISFVHFFLQHHGLGETDVHFHADNCGGQNKKQLLFVVLRVEGY